MPASVISAGGGNRYVIVDYREPKTCPGVFPDDRINRTGRGVARGGTLQLPICYLD